MTVAVHAPRNAVLAMLPTAVLERIDPRLPVVALTAGDVLFDAGERIDDVYFPLDTVVSLEQVVGDADHEHARSPAVALAGAEGMVGFEVFFGASTAINRASVRIAGQAVRIAADVLREEFARAGAFQRLVVRSSDALVAQLCGVAACERVHPVMKRLVRWLLSFDDRVRTRELGLTQEALSQVLGVRRVSVSAAASRLQAAGYIAYRRGQLVILDRQALDGMACNCYRAIRARYEAYLNDDE